MLTAIKNFFLDYVLLAWDFWLSLVTFLLAIYFLPYEPNLEFAKSLYGIGIATLSVVFSVYFAGLAVLISFGDNKFVKFLEEDGSFTSMINKYRNVLYIIFFSLIYSIAWYILVSYKKTNNDIPHNEYIFSFFIALFMYSLFASLTVVINSINYAKWRVQFIQGDNDSKNDNRGN